jgi:signal transduction histidine kinase
MEIVSYRKDGGSFWNQVTMHPIRSASSEIEHWISVERDVTQAVERESKREDQHARLLQLTSAALQVFGALDVRTLTSRMEEAVRDLIGGIVLIHRIPQLPRQFDDELLARAAATRGHTTDESRFRAAASAASTGPPSYVLEVRAGSGRTLRPADLFIVDLLAEYYGVAVRNASLVEELEERRSAILELNQVKSDLIAMLAHDFKSPLTSIVGFTELAMELGPVNADQREYLESVKRIALHLADLASDTLALSRMERNEIDLSLEQLDIAAMAREVAASLQDQRAVAVHAPAAAVVQGDRHRLRQVLYNLIENAIKYSPRGEPVDVRVEVSGDRLTVTVTDRGIGIPQTEVASIFGRFSRASNARRLRIGGTGFGLYLTRQIVELHGGALGVTSAEGKGSTFTVDLPVSAAEQYEAPLRVVVAQHEREARSFLAHALRETGFRVRVAHSGHELFDLLAQEPAEHVVVDCDDIVVSSEEMARLQQQQTRGELQIVALSKPFLLQDLLSAIRSRPA